MKRALPWLISAILLVAFGASFSELQRIRKRFSEATRPVHYHVHADVRRAIIAQQLTRVESPIVVLGDSLIEAATFPSAICGHPVVNAGIGGAQLLDFRFSGLEFLDGTRPALVVVALGMNDALGGSDTFESDLIQLLKQIRQISPNVAAFGISEAETGPLVENSAALNNTIAMENRTYAEIMGPAFTPSPSLGSQHTLDGVHLAPAAYQKWANSLFAAIEAAACPSPAIR
ncbi:lysophospholipase L1-like esterase [Bradyrhizobium macuxiense]|uniref:Lysophospholipase L1-like esterase n=1 Tax=Bradyrhizobium macuxiense TaxID=1755647 RepID=A0A560KV79_9BRAD|nr:SGNH/GDSL hydrolase family protein [Bradyrhizobium macuxiense]TWB87146.1 lysophospholipase L1-like esterase [Bradyrhizobium macuxiense]